MLLVLCLDGARDRAARGRGDLEVEHHRVLSTTWKPVVSESTASSALLTVIHAKRPTATSAMPPATTAATSRPRGRSRDRSGRRACRWVVGPARRHRGSVARLGWSLQANRSRNEDTCTMRPPPRAAATARRPPRRRSNPDLVTPGPWGFVAIAVRRGGRGAADLDMMRRIRRARVRVTDRAEMPTQQAAERPGTTEADGDEPRRRAG